MKIFFSDMDGTLLKDDKTISPEMREAIDAFVAAGNTFVISTGRALSSALVLRDRYALNYPGSYLSAFNGGILYDNTAETIVSRIGLPLEIVEEVFAIADVFRIHIQTYTGPYILSRTYNEALEDYMRHTSMAAVIAPDYRRELTEIPCKVLAIDLHDPERLQQFRDAATTAFGDAVNIVSSEPTFVEICPPQVDKGHALRRLSELLHVPVSQTLSAGDAENDISMLRAAGLGIAMLNAADPVKQAADVITQTDNNHNGLLPFLREV